jgi:mitochondrial fission protein ELM1
MKSLKKICWVVTDGKAGSFAQAMGLAEACGFKIILPKIFKAAFPFSLFPSLARYLSRVFLTSESDSLCGSWPDVAIGCGHGAVASMIHIRQLSRGKTFCIYVLNPRVSSKHFDLVIKMKHDSITGQNVIASDLSLNRVSKAKLVNEARKFKSEFQKFRKPYYAVLIGGNTKHYTMSNAACSNLIAKIDFIIKQCQGSVLITSSRRTPALVKDALAKLAAAHNNVYLADLSQNRSNPYLAMLAVSEKIFVTQDSVNMISEACCAKKTTYIIPLLGLRKGKSLKFINELKRQGFVSMFEDKSLGKNQKIRANNNQVIAHLVCDIMKRKLK